MPYERRLLDDWLTGYLDYTSEHEAVEQIHRWVGLCLLSGALQRKVWLTLRYEDIFPNLYVIIVAESAKARKSAAMGIGQRLFTDALPDARVMTDSMTSQGLIKAINRKVQVLKDDQFVDEFKSDVFIFADEVANLFGYDKTRSAQLTIFLTRTYTCPATYDHTTVRDSTIRCYNVYPTLLGGTDPRNLKVIPDEAAGGLTGRLIWLIVTTRRKNDSGWVIDPDKQVQLELKRELLMHDLQRINKLSGSMAIEESAMAFYDNWYAELANRDEQDKDVAAFYHRCHTTALHVATLLSISRSDDMIITLDDMRKGIICIEEQLPTIKRVLMWAGPSDYEQQRNKLLSLLIKSPKHILLRKIALRELGIKAEDFDKLAVTLQQDGSIQIPTTKIAGEVIIRLTDAGLSRINGKPDGVP